MIAQSPSYWQEMRFSARCCPTRASLLTGLYPHDAHAGLESGIANLVVRIKSSRHGETGICRRVGLMEFKCCVAL